MREYIPVSRLKGLGIVFEDDMYELARFILKVQLAQDTPMQRARTTVNGLIGCYQKVAQIDEYPVRKMVEAHGLPLGATIEPDEESRQDSA